MCGVGRYSVAVSSCWFCSYHTVFSSWLVDRQRRQITSRLHESLDRQHYCLTFCKSEFCYTFVQYKPKKCTFVKLIFKFVFYMFRNREFIFRKKVVRAGHMFEELQIFISAYEQILQISVMGLPRVEVNLRRLLCQCESMAKGDLEKDWRLDKYIGALDEMVINLQKHPDKPSKDTMADYVRRIMFLKGIIETHKLTNPAEKVAAAQLLSHGSATSSEATTKEIHQATTSKYTKELRDQLFENEKGTEDRLRQRKQRSTGEDLDVLLKYHHSMQEKIADDMLLLTRNLKEQSQLASSIIRKDTETTEKSSNIADRNFSNLKVESERLEKHSQRACKCWIWVIVAVVIIIFINMVLFMKVVKKKS